MIRFTQYHLLILSMFIIPQALLQFAGIYDGKLKVYFDYNSNFLISLGFVAFYALIFLTSARFGIQSNTSLRTAFKHLESRTYFRLLCISITVVSFALLIFGVGFKNSSSSLNFLIMMVPRELVLVAATIGVMVSKKFFWKFLIVFNILYWILVGSKSSLFLVLVTAFYVVILCEIYIHWKYFVWGGIAFVLLPFTFIVPAMMARGHDIASIMEVLASADDIYAVVAPSMASRISWYDGLFLIPADATWFRNVDVVDLIVGALSRFVPGVQTSIASLGELSIYYFKAAKLSNFAGAIGTPAVLKMTFYAQGLIAMLLVAAFFWVVHFAIFRMATSAIPILAIVGMTGLVISLKSLVISGNIDTAVGRIGPILFCSFFYLWLGRMLMPSSSRRMGLELEPART